MSGTYDDKSPEEIQKAIQNALAEQRLAEFAKAVVHCEASLILALSNGDDLC